MEQDQSKTKSAAAVRSSDGLGGIEPTRSVESLSLLWPLTYGDIIELDGPEGGECWRVDRSSAGWYLHKLDGATVATRHPSIHSLDGMADFIHAILEWSKGYAS